VNLRKIILILWSVFIVCGIASVMFGRSGIIAMRQLECERDRLAANMDKLRTLNGELEGALAALRSDPDAVSVYARELGYASSSDERFIRIAGLPAASRRTAQAGNLLKTTVPWSLSDDGIRLIGAIFGVFLCVASASAGIRASLRRRSRREF
jgi:cell division protein FtsB